MSSLRVLKSVVVVFAALVGSTAVNGWASPGGGGAGDEPESGAVDSTGAMERRAKQVEVSAVGHFGPSGGLSPGARLGFEWRPWMQFGIGTGATFLTTSNETNVGEISGRRFAADAVGTLYHPAENITSSAAVGLRAGWTTFRSVDLDVDEGAQFFSQMIFRGRGEWAFLPAFYLLFQMELAFAIVPAEVVVDGAVLERVRGMEADLSLGVGFRF